MRLPDRASLFERIARAGAGQNDDEEGGEQPARRQLFRLFSAEASDARIAFSSCETRASPRIPPDA